MKKPSAVRTGAFGLVAGLVVIAATYLGNRLAGLPYLPFDIFDWLARVLPGRLVATSIDTMVMIIRGLRLGPTASTAKLAEQGMALVQFAATWVVFGLILGVAGRRRPERLTLYGATGGLLLFLSATGIEAARGFAEASPLAALPWLGLVLIGGGALLGRTLSALSAASEASPEDAISRRRFLRLVGTGSFVVMVTAAGVSVVSKRKKASLSEIDQEEIVRAAGTSGPAASPAAGELEKRFPPVPGTRAELTANRDFYRIDINLQPPKVDGKAWRLKLGGLVDHPARSVPRRHPVEAAADPGADPVLHLQPGRRRPHQHQLLDGRPLQGHPRRSGVEGGRQGDLYRVGRRLLRKRASRRGPGRPHPARLRDERRAADGRPRLSPARLHPRSFRDEAAQVDRPDGGHRP